MAPKNKKKSSFYFFMKEMKDKEAAKGRIISMLDIPQIAHPIWKRMSVAEKEPYEKMAKDHKSDPSITGAKLASDGTRCADNKNEAEEKENHIQRLKQAVKNYVNPTCMPLDQFQEFTSRKVLYFISFNILCRTENDYLPNEVGVVEYSIKNGIHKVYHKIISPGRIPTGFAGEAKRLNEVHEIDVYGKDATEKDLKKVYREIKEFTNPDYSDEYPPLFCINEMIDRSYGCLDYLAYCCGEENCFDVWSAINLLMGLRNPFEDPEEMTTETIASDLLTKTNFNHHPCARCEFHEEKDNHNCALAYSKRLCYLLSDAVCTFFDVELSERHMPTMAFEEKPYTVFVGDDQPKSSKYNHNPSLPLDSRSSYYSGVESDVDGYSDIQSNISSSITSGHRQPASTCVSAQMARLNLNMTSASAPGHGIGRGQRRPNN